MKPLVASLILVLLVLGLVYFMLTFLPIKSQPDQSTNQTNSTISEAEQQALANVAWCNENRTGLFTIKFIETGATCKLINTNETVDISKRSPYGYYLFWRPQLYLNGGEPFGYADESPTINFPATLIDSKGIYRSTECDLKDIPGNMSLGDEYAKFSSEMQNGIHNSYEHGCY